MQIAARQSFLTGRAGPSTPTARDYVQDGLVAMWDGIENVGFGQHDESATEWKNLAGNADYDVTLTSKAKFVNNAMEVASSGGRIAGSENALPRNDNNYHCEIVMGYDGVYSGGALMIFTGGGSFESSGAALASPIVLYAWSFYSRKGVVVGNPATLFRADTNYTFTGIHQASGTRDFMAWDGQVLSFTSFTDTLISRERNDGIMFSFATTNRSYDMPVGFRVHALRIYAARLSEADRLANYAVDAVRFGL